jgi:NADH-quinone oxidoreductase subunit N
LICFEAIVNPLTDERVQHTLTGVFRLAGPEIALIGTACVVFLIGCFYNRRWLGFVVSLLGVALAAILAGAVKTQMPESITIAPIIPDAAGAFVRWVAIVSAAVFLFVSWAEVNSEHAAEYYACSLVAAAGVSLVGRANDLVTLFLALELLSIPTYVLLYLPNQRKLNQEAAVKYFLLSVMASAVLLFGFSYLYGLTGSTNITAIVNTLAAGNKDEMSPLALAGVALVIAAVGFRITAVPFHFYAPDVYEGGPAGVVAQIAFFPKVAGFVALARVLGLIASDGRVPFDAATQVPLLLWILAILTMCVGNVLALLQDNVRRMLAYSGVAHGGYLLMGVIVAGSFTNSTASGQAGMGGIDAMLFYLVAYGAMTVGAFAVILFLSTPERPIDSIEDLSGVGETHPLTAGAMAVFMLSLIGLPLTAGFVGKLLLFIGAFSAPADDPSMRHLYQILAVVAAVNAAVGAYYYLRVVGVMYLRTPLRPKTDSRAFPTAFAAVVLAAFTLFFGIYPEPIARAARNAAPPPALETAK